MKRWAVSAALLLLALGSTSGCASTLHNIGQAWRRNECSKDVGRDDRQRCADQLVESDGRIGVNP